MQIQNTKFEIGNYIAEQTINHNPYLFDVDGNDKDIGKKIWEVRHRIYSDILYFKTKQSAKDRMTYLALQPPTQDKKYA